MATSNAPDSIATSLARYDPYGNFRTAPTATNPSLTSRGFTGHAHNNTGVYPTQNVGLIYMNARYYLPEIGRFISADTIVPEPENPQSYNRYSYALNSPLKYTDPSGHCVILAGVDTVACVVIGGAVVLVAGVGVVAMVDLVSPTFNPTEDLVNALSAEAARIVDNISYQIQQAQTGKPLTPDERKQIEKIDQMPGWLDDHPDLADEAERVQNGEVLPERADHVREAGQRIQSLDNAIKHLQGVRPHRNPTAQEEIDAAIERAQDYRQRLSDILEGNAE